MKNDRDTILIVDDNSASLMSLFECLKKSGFNVWIAADAETALARIDHEPPDIILLDIRLPGINGFEMAGRLKANKKSRDIPIIFMTVCDRVEDKVKGFALGAVDYVTKPVELKEIMARVNARLTIRDLEKRLEAKNDQLRREVAERTRAEKRTKAALAEKEVLLREVHHRVKNNLQALIYLIDMQAEANGDKGTTQTLGEFQGRIRAMALVHEKLYHAKNVARIDFEEYLESLTVSLFHSLADGRPIGLHVDAANHRISVHIAIPCGMIVNELVTNSLKYAFPTDHFPVGRGGAAPPEISVAFGARGKDYFLRVSDNGVGMPPGQDWRAVRTLGLKLVDILATRQLGGRIELDQGPGAAFKIQFANR
ncbi:MAG: response regulator [Desulfobacterales bacterium]|nr:response regulator [Desulfobacterales bacterium]